MFELVFWTCSALVVYAYAGFPLVIILLGQVFNRSVDKGDCQPTVSMLIAAHNEEAVIKEKIENTLALDYPVDKIEVIVASDGSTDGTEEIVAAYADRGVRLLCLRRGGKVAALDHAIRVSSGEILLFTDANTLWHPQAVNHLCRNFNDPDVGGVCGNQGHINLDDSDHSGEGEKLYWKYDKWLKSLQSRIGSIVSADGAIYAIRRAFYQLPPSRSVTDDFVISTGVIEQGYRLVFEPQAMASEPPSSSANKEFSRKVRIISTGLRSVFIRKALLNPFRFGLYSLVLFSHKVLRRFVPVLLILMLLASLMLATEKPAYMLASLMQLMFYALAFLGYLLRTSPIGKWKIFYVPFFYCLANGAALAAIFRVISGEKTVLWEPAR